MRVYVSSLINDCNWPKVRCRTRNDRSQQVPDTRMCWALHWTSQLRNCTESVAVVVVEVVLEID